MMDFHRFKKAIIAVCLPAVFIWYPGSPAVGGVKTSLKNYSIITHENQAVLCEPYTVKKDDWLYKIFRQKGEISEQDFPLFISIFKKINPGISNIDTISPGIQILIPLKMVNKQAYASDDTGMVAVPVVEFSHLPASFDVTSYVREHIIQPGDTVSDLLDKAFLQKGGGVTREGRMLFYRLNPNIKNIHMVHKGTRVMLPDPGILSQPWFSSYLTHGTLPAHDNWEKKGVLPQDAAAVRAPENALPDVSPYQILQLKRYAALINGTLVHQGKMYFPTKNDDTIVQLDLSRTPLIETSDTGEKTLLIPGNRTGYILDKKMIQTIKSHWKQVKTEQIQAAIQKARQHPQETVPLDVIKSNILQILAGTPFDYTPEEKIRFLVNDISMSGVFGRIKRPDRSDLLINFAHIYGTGITRIQNMGFDILTFSPNQSWKEQIRLLLSALGYTIWENPSFSHQKMVETLEGLYAELLPDRIFVSQYPLTPGASMFLKTEQIRYIHLK